MSTNDTIVNVGDEVIVKVGRRYRRGKIAGIASTGIKVLVEFDGGFVREVYTSDVFVPRGRIVTA